VGNTPKEVEFERRIDLAMNIKSGRDTHAVEKSSDKEEVLT